MGHGGARAPHFWRRGSVDFPADFPWSTPDPWLTYDHFVGKASAMGKQLYANSAFHLFWIGK